MGLTRQDAFDPSPVVRQQQCLELKSPERLDLSGYRFAYAMELASVTVQGPSQACFENGFSLLQGELLLQDGSPQSAHW